MACIISTNTWVKGIILTIAFIGLLHAASASENSISELKHQLSSFDDPRITAEDLAFFLVTHNYDSSPREGYVELKLNGITYRLVPNGSKPGLCDILPENTSTK